MCHFMVKLQNIAIMRSNALTLRLQLQLKQHRHDDWDPENNGKYHLPLILNAL